MSDNTQLTTKTQDLPAEITAKSVISDAQDKARRLMQIVREQKLSKNFGGEKDHIEVEAWQLLGRFHQYTARTKENSVQFIKYGEVEGFSAYAEILDKDGNVVGGAEASCMRDEPSWNTKSKYVWKNGEKVKIGEEKVPLYSLKSMAQTRAVSKAYRQMLSYIAVLAGYAPTPAEEMDGIIVNDKVDKMPGVRGEVPVFGREAQIARNTPTDQPATQAQLSFLNNKLKSKMTAEEFENYRFLNRREASALIDQLLKRKAAPVEVNDQDQEEFNEQARDEEESKWDRMASEANRRMIDI